MLCNHAEVDLACGRVFSQVVYSMHADCVSAAPVLARRASSSSRTTQIVLPGGENDFLPQSIEGECVATTFEPYLSFKVSLG